MADLGVVLYTIHDISLVIYISIAILGIIGNTLMYLVYSKSSLSKLSVSIYFRAMALSNLLINFNLIRLFFEIWSNFLLIDYSEFSCRSISYLSFVGASLSAWFELAASIDRFLAILYPNRFKMIQKKIFKFIFILSLTVYNFAVYFPLLFDYFIKYSFDQNGNIITQRCITFSTTSLERMDFINSTAVPFLFMINFSAATMFGIARSRNRVNNINMNLNSLKIKNRDLKFGLTIISVNIIFFVLNLPKRFFFMMNLDLLVSQGPLGMTISTTVIMILHYTFFSITFYIQLLVNSIFRKQLVYLLKAPIKKILGSNSLASNNSSSRVY